MAGELSWIMVGAALHNDLTLSELYSVDYIGDSKVLCHTTWGRCGDVCNVYLNKHSQQQDVRVLAEC